MVQVESSRWRGRFSRSHEKDRMHAKTMRRAILRSILLIALLVLFFRNNNPISKLQRILQPSAPQASATTTQSRPLEERKEQEAIDAIKIKQRTPPPPFLGKHDTSKFSSSVSSSSPTQFLELDFDSIQWPASPQEEPPVTLPFFKDNLEMHLPRGRSVISTRLLRQMTLMDSDVPYYHFLGSDNTIISNNAFYGFPDIKPEKLNPTLDLEALDSNGFRVAVVEALDKQYTFSNRIRDTLDNLLRFHTQMKKLRANACIVIICDHSDLKTLLKTISDFEFVFNRNAQYPYVFISKNVLSEHFRSMIRSVISSTAEFGQIPKEHWDIPLNIDQDVLQQRLKSLRTRYLHGDSLWHRRMFRYKARFLHHHPLLEKFRYSWRLEIGSEFRCMVRYDPILFMALSKKRLGFASVTQDAALAIPGLWNRTITFMQQNSLPLSPFFRAAFFDPTRNDTNGNMFDKNFQIADLEFFRSDIYKKYMDILDDSRGFFYERFGDGIVQSFAAAMLLPPNEIHHFADISHYYNEQGTCPVTENPDFAEFLDICWCKRDRSWSDQWFLYKNLIQVLVPLNKFTSDPTNYL